jgi:hypothetical protein
LINTLNRNYWDAAYFGISYYLLGRPLVACYPVYDIAFYAFRKRPPPMIPLFTDIRKRFAL